MTTPDDAALLAALAAHDDPLVRLLAQRYAALVAELAAHRRALGLSGWCAGPAGGGGRDERRRPMEPDPMPALEALIAYGRTHTDALVRALARAAEAQRAVIAAQAQALGLANLDSPAPAYDPMPALSAELRAGVARLSDPGGPGRAEDVRSGM